jgi:PAS domain S-box-containing protein
MEKRNSEEKEILIAEMEAKIQELQNELENHLLTDKKLKESEEKFRIISDQSLMGVVIYQDYLVKYVNKAAADIFERSVETFLSYTQFNQLESLFHTDDVDFIREQVQKKQFGEKGYVTNYAFRFIPQLGKLKWIEVFSKTITYKGKPADLVTLIDISERIKAEEKLRKNEELYRTLF